MLGAKGKDSLWPNIRACPSPVCLSRHSPLSFTHLTANRAPPGTPQPVSQDLSPPGAQDFGLMGMKRWLGWHLVCGRGWRGRNQPGPGSALGEKRAFLATDLGSPWLRGCSHLSRSGARKGSSRERRASLLPAHQRSLSRSPLPYPRSTELICVMTCLQRISRLCPGIPPLPATATATGSEPRAAARAALQRGASPCPRCRHPRLAPEDADTSISGQTGGFGHQSPGDE